MKVYIVVEVHPHEGVLISDVFLKIEDAESLEAKLKSCFTHIEEKELLE